MKNALTVIGGILLAVGPALVSYAPTGTLWVIGTIFSSVGGVLVGTRGSKNLK